jgi:hypothetical protein
VVRLPWLRSVSDRAGVGERLGGFVYGTVLVLSVVVVGAKAFPDAPGRVAILVAVTTFVFWAAHVYADALTYSVAHDAHLSLAELRHIARHEAAILEAGVLPEAALLLGAIGLLSESASGWVALGLGSAVLVTAGIVFARVERLAPLQALAVVLANLALGVALIFLKVLIAH